MVRDGLAFWKTGCEDRSQWCCWCEKLNTETYLEDAQYCVDYLHCVWLWMGCLVGIELTGVSYVVSRWSFASVRSIDSEVTQPFKLNLVEL